MKCDFIVAYEKSQCFKHLCIRCGTITDWTPTRYNPFRVCKKKGLGDIFEASIRWAGIRPRCGGCQKRKDRLNNLDRRLYRFFRGPRNATYSEKSTP